MQKLFEQLYVSPKRFQEKVLIIDDSEETCLLLSRLLVNHDKSYKILNFPQFFSRELERENYDLIIMDIMMPTTSGYQLLSDLRRSYSKDGLPVIMISSKTDDVDVEKAYSCGANAFIKKPINFEQAWSKISHHLMKKNFLF